MAATKPTTRKTKDTAGSRDKVFGLRLRQRRTFLGMSQQDLGEAVELTFQQVQKYEHGTNKISAARLIDFAEILNVPVTYFFGGMADIGEKTPKGLAVSDVPQATLENDLILQKESMQLLKHYYSIDDEEMRKTVQNLVKQMADQATASKK